MKLTGVAGILAKNLHYHLSMISRSPISHVPTVFWLTKVSFHNDIDDVIAAVHFLLHSTVPINKTVLHHIQGKRIF